MKGIYLIILFVIIGTIFVVYLFNCKFNYIDTRVSGAVWAVQQMNHKFKNDSLSTEIRDSLESVIVNQKLEQESYAQMYNRESDRVILYVSILFAFFGVIGFSIFKYEISHITVIVENYEKAHNEDKKVQDKVLLDLKELVYKGEGNLCYLMSQYAKQSNAILSEILYCILAAKYFKKLHELGIELRSDKYDPIDANLDNAIRSIDELAINPKILQDHIKDDVQDLYQKIQISLSELFKFNDEKIIDKASIIKSKLKKLDG